MKWYDNFLRSWRHHASVQIATLSVLTGTYVVIVLSLTLHQNLETLLTRWGSEVKVNVYLKDEAGDAERSKAKNYLEESTLFQQIKYVDKDTAYKNFQSRMSHMVPSLVQDKNFENPLPASFEGVLSKEKVTALGFEALGELAASLSELSGVDEVSYGQGWIENYASSLKVLSLSGFVFLIFLASGSLLIIGNSIRSSISQRREEIEIMELFGATRSMVQNPFIVEGAIMGLSAAVIATGLGYGVFLWQSKVLIEGLSFWSLKDLLGFLSFGEIFGFWIAGSAIGAMGAWFCVRKVSTGWAAAERI